MRLFVCLIFMFACKGFEIRFKADSEDSDEEVLREVNKGQSLFGSSYEKGSASSPSGSDISAALSDFPGFEVSRLSSSASAFV